MGPEKRSWEELQADLNTFLEEEKKLYNLFRNTKSADGLWLVFYRDNGNREDCSVYYSWVVEAETGLEAINKVASMGPHPIDIESLDFEPVTVVR